VAASTTSTTTPLTPLTTLLQQLAPALKALSGSDDGIASWFYAPPGTCAHRDLPLGTVVTITRLATGASTTCRVADRGPTLATKRVIDLSPDVFDKLASRDAGVIEVLLNW
jgi:rare lipoprotein A